ncbi:MAG TPA: putative metallopeptidase [Steroidobacteraceae bacterium]|nr:putative metallopeptidase [Steroidobacteraceae bacterium]
MKRFTAASTDLADCIEHALHEYHSELKDVTVGALFVFDEDSEAPPLMHGGYPAAAVVRITPIRDRALGVPDAVIVVDRDGWVDLTGAQRVALIDHELTHLSRVLDEKTQRPKRDAIGRPKLRIRKHDHQLGWFDEIAQRHGENSPEIRQARALVEQTQQLYFDFSARLPAKAA